ncbi:TetR/AcrR family transcriptional regulator [Pendulispora brunnea]|uniref:TetR/AcrR family transcriptional regulator n=1 Tax=Pendulispora brunnea TaxID=2905690 RepID=A0ABZ2KBV7_9BACT
MTTLDTDERDTLRRRQILASARAVFVQFGFDKSSMDDIAKRANLSRGLVYRKFKNREELLQAVFEDLFVGRYERAAHVVAGAGSKRDKLLRIYEILYLEPWDEMMGSPMAPELYQACKRFDPEGVDKRERMRLRYTQAILGDKSAAEVFMLSVEGLSGTDIPSTSVLRRRIQLLCERFAEARPNDETRDVK